MTEAQRIQNLTIPTGPVDVVLDTDTANEIDDQYAIAYLLRSGEKLRTQAIYAAPFNKYDIPPSEGMELSYQEILHVLDLMGENVPTLRGSDGFLPNEQTPIKSPAAEDLVARAKNYSPERPLYVVAIGAITNIASAILLDPQIVNKIVVVWLGGNAFHFHVQNEFNLRQDIAAARVVFGSGVPLVLLPCQGVVSAFTISKPEIEHWLLHKNPLADYLASITIKHVESYKNLPAAWSKVLWDVTAVAWLLNDGERFMRTRLAHTPMPSYDGYYTAVPNSHMLNYVYDIKRDRLLDDLIKKLIVTPL